MPIVYEPASPMRADISTGYGALQQANLDFDRQMKLAELQAQMANRNFNASFAGGGRGGGGGGGGGGVPSGIPLADPMELAQNQAALHAQAANVVDQTALSTRENMRLQQMQNSIGEINSRRQTGGDGRLTDEEADDAIIQLRTGINPLLQRQQRAQAAMLEQQQQQMERLAARQAAADRIRNEALNGNPSYMWDPQVRGEVEEELRQQLPEGYEEMFPDDFRGEVEQIATRRGGRLQMMIGRDGEPQLVPSGGRGTRGTAGTAAAGAGMETQRTGRGQGLPAGILDEGTWLRDRAAARDHARQHATTPEAAQQELEDIDRVYGRDYHQDYLPRRLEVARQQQTSEAAVRQHEIANARRRLMGEREQPPEQRGAPGPTPEEAGRRMLADLQARRPVIEGITGISPERKRELQGNVDRLTRALREGRIQDQPREIQELYFQTNRDLDALSPRRAPVWGRLPEHVQGAGPERSFGLMRQGVQQAYDQLTQVRNFVGDARPTNEESRATLTRLRESVDRMQQLLLRNPAHGTVGMNPEERREYERLTREVNAQAAGASQQPGFRWSNVARAVGLGD